MIQALPRADGGGRISPPLLESGTLRALGLKHPAFCRENTALSLVAVWRRYLQVEIHKFCVLGLDDMKVTVGKHRFGTGLCSNSSGKLAVGII